LLILAVFSTIFLLMAPPANAARAPHHREFHDSRHHLNRSYPARGVMVKRIPRDHHIVVHSGVRYQFYNGIWYRPHRGSFVVVAPPLGLFVPFLPPYYATIWVGGIPYYYANNIYYTHCKNGYKVIAPPAAEAISQVPPPAEQLFIYPRNSQSEEQQARDRYACHSWAVSQTGFDPTQPHKTASETQKTGTRADYQRAIAACLDGRGYTVK
jgi:hypothetical protein